MIKNLNNICDSATFEQVFKTYAKDLRQFLYFKTKDVALAEDLMQDAFVKLWDNCSKVDNNKVKSYLYTIANNLFINLYNREKVKLKHLSQSAHSVNYETPEFVIEENEFLKKINNVIASLPEKQREVFLMNRIEKKKYKEIAELLGISVKAVEKRMHQALSVIRDKIGNI